MTSFLVDFSLCMAELLNQIGKGARVFEFFTLCYVILTIEPVIRGQEPKRLVYY